MSTLEQLMLQYAAPLKEFWFDVDGVMTAQQGLVIYDVNGQSELRGFVRNDGITSITLVPCDHHGVPLSNVVEYVAGYEDEPIMEGYRFDPRDGKVVEYLVQHQLPTFFISGRNSPCVRKRAKTLGAVPLLGEKDKLSVIKTLSKTSLSQLLFIGDGIQDVEAMEAIKDAGGFTCAPADACDEAKIASVYIAEAKGGGGVVHEVVSAYLRSVNLWPS